jgi:SSS family solute:Na+ symporter
VTALPAIDLLVLLVYLAATVGLGLWFAFRRRSTSEFMTGGHALPGWAVGLSMFGSYVSSISFLANPGKALASNWNAFVFSLATPIAALVAVRWFVPFYRRAGNVSAYEHLERRFGPWARTYAVACFLLTQMARTGTILFLLALAVKFMLGWDVRLVIVLTGAVMILNTVFGGIKAAVWIGVLQSVVLLAGPVVCLVALLVLVPGGFGKIVHVANDADKFSLGSFGASVSQPTFWVTLMMGLAINLGNFGVDQSYVQRYVSTATDREAKHSVLITAILYVPVAAFFFFIGTTLFVLQRARPELFKVDFAARPDDVFPYFISHLLPVGLGGLVIAGIFAAAMDSTLSNMATLTLCDLYKRYFRPDAGERESMRILSLSTLGWGVLSIVVALAMINARSVLDVWWELASLFSGGMLGLFLLGLISRQHHKSAGGLVAVTVGIVVILWMSISRTSVWPASLSAIRSPFHPFLITVVGTLTILVVGLIAERMLRTRSGRHSTRAGEAFGVAASLQSLSRRSIEEPVQ